MPTPTPSLHPAGSLTNVPGIHYGVYGMSNGSSTVIHREKYFLYIFFELDTYFIYECVNDSATFGHIQSQWQKQCHSINISQCIQYKRATKRV